MEAALKMARQYFVEIGPAAAHATSSRGGRATTATRSARWRPAATPCAARPIAPLLIDAFTHVSPCYAYRDRRDDESADAYVARLAAELEAEFQRLGPTPSSPSSPRPVVGATLGCVTALPGYFAAHARDLRPPRRRC